jgi:hypothetical protein
MARTSADPRASFAAVPSVAGVVPPVAPMLARLASQLPADGEFLFEPKWDGFRALVFCSAHDVYIQSRDLRPLDRYFPELHDALAARLPAPCVIDGEIVIATASGLDFDALQMRRHPAAPRVTKLARETPCRASVRPAPASASAVQHPEREVKRGREGNPREIGQQQCAGERLFAPERQQCRDNQ